MDKIKKWLCEMGFHTGPVFAVGYPLITSKKNHPPTLLSLYKIRRCARRACGQTFSTAKDAFNAA